jgi:hypothetical protein
MKNEPKTYSQLVEFVGFNYPTVAPITGVQAYDDVDNAAGPQSVEDPGNLDRLNAYISQINDHQYINPYYAINTLWRKLQVIGLNFDLRSMHFHGEQSGNIELPLTQFGGRYGYLGTDGSISHDDGISHRIPGGLKLVLHWVNINGVYTVDGRIARNHEEGPFMETTTPAQPVA